jgi:hypothetical protein
MFVTTFFSISGTVLYYNYPKITSTKGFILKDGNQYSHHIKYSMRKQQKTICFFYFYLKNVFKFHKLFYKGHWSKLFLTLFGMDGYLSYRINSYYLIGEWFLGAIIIIYFLYPFLSWLMNKSFLILHSLICFGYLLMYKTNFFFLKDTINSFYFGMIIIKFYKIFFNKKYIFFISFLLLNISLFS